LLIYLPSFLSQETVNKGTICGLRIK